MSKHSRGLRRLKRLKDRISKGQQTRRELRIEARRTVATELARGIARSMGQSVMLTEPLRRGFFGRLKWLVAGR
jgi:hypothetical protein